MAVGRDFKGRQNNCIAVIGDGAITGGMAYEAMNHAGFLDTNMIVVLNDNQQVWRTVMRRQPLASKPQASGPHAVQVSLPTQYNGKNQEPVGALSSTLARLQVGMLLQHVTAYFPASLTATGLLCCRQTGNCESCARLQRA